MRYIIIKPAEGTVALIESNRDPYGREQVESLIQQGEIARPQNSVNGEVFWEWEL